MRRAHTGQLFGLFLIPTPVFGWILPLGWVSGWVGGMGQFGMISPHGLIPFRLGIWTGTFLVGDMDRPFSSWGYGLAPF